ncbi:ring finger protein [Apiospora rasikravindrae]|uniref:RBR-type E3 ubiquitin transferase n=1 Tax=Apiospora rasikravindrae TaxID=990691 RepID=A0ABR1UBJ1_9PEZI
MVHRSAPASQQHTRPPYGNHSRGHASHHRQPREPPVQREEVPQLSEIKLVDLDRLRPDIRIGIPPSVSRLSRISAFLRRKYRGDVYSIGNDAGISFYHGGAVVRDDMIPRAIAALYYRAARSGAGRSLRLLWSDRLEFCPPEVDELMDSIEAGITIRELRADIAAYLGVDDSSRVVVSARDGLRPGLLQGDNWEARRAGMWLCQTLFIDLVAERNYVVMRGVNEDRRKGGRTDLEDISMFLEGKPLGRHSRVSLGSTVEFQLARTAHHQFVQEEGWLVPESETCVVCSDEKRISEFPARIAKTCNHQPATCRGCIGQWISSSMESVSWDRLKCPECSGFLAFEDVRAFADPETFERYDSLATKAALESFRDFRWCLNPRCSAGQIHKAACARVKCHACKASLCSHHNLPWHGGETCEAYDWRTRRQRKSDKASEKKVKEMTKSCPRCHKDVYKYSGCDHITCVCGHEWCYLCLGEYYHDQESFLQCKHKSSCRYFQNPPQLRRRSGLNALYTASQHAAAAAAAGEQTVGTPTAPYATTSLWPTAHADAPYT